MANNNMQIQLRTGVNIRLCFQIDIKYSQVLFCPKSSSHWGDRGGGRGWVCLCHRRCVSPAKPQAPPPEMSDARRRWRCLWELWLPLTPISCLQFSSSNIVLPIFCLHSHKKHILATKQGAGSSPLRPSVPTCLLCTDGAVMGTLAAF